MDDPVAAQKAANQREELRKNKELQESLEDLSMKHSELVRIFKMHRRD